MSLIKSVSGIRGTIGGKSGENLTPVDIVAFVSAYGAWIRENFTKPCIVVGRDGRISGEIVKNIVVSTLQSMGIDVIDVDYSTTPTVEMYVRHCKSSGGIIITASHNPAEWNALKFLNHDGEFISSEIGEAIRQQAESGTQSIDYGTINNLGKKITAKDAIEKHIDAIINHPLIDAEKIGEAGIHAVVDCINSTGNISIPVLLDKLGVTFTLMNDGNYGHFAHNPEPLPGHLEELCDTVVKEEANLGISVDPDVDRLALVSETGEFFGEEYTLVCAADYVLNHRSGPVVTNLSSSSALKDLAIAKGQECFFAPVGEVHVVNEMKLRNAVLGGEGNGGVIDPELHYGRDALIGIAFVLMNMATSGKSLSQLRNSYPEYHMVKDKFAFDATQSAQSKLDHIASLYKDQFLDTRDGLKITFPDSWVQLRKSNTEPILRIYSEAKTPEAARKLVEDIKAAI